MEVPAAALPPIPPGDVSLDRAAIFAATHIGGQNGAYQINDERTSHTVSNSGERTACPERQSNGRLACWRRRPRLRKLYPVSARAPKQARESACASQTMNEDLLALFRQTGALLDGHFVLRSGLHSRQYFQCALLLQHTEIAAKVCGWLADKLRGFACDAVISPALGGMIVGQEVARSLGKRHIFVEKESGGLALRRGFKIEKGEQFIVAEDVVTRGGRVQQTIDIVAAHGGIVQAVGVLVDRSGKEKPQFGCPFVGLIEMTMETFAADKLPAYLAAIPAEKPGSK
jgi:orotate phosphoribosyltransferase